MNTSSDRDPSSLRSDIDQTRGRMDQTMDALGERLQPRHLLDEVLGFFRSNNANGDHRLSDMRQKISHGADQAMHAVVDTVKKNPVPALLIGGGIAWLIYENSRTRREEREGRAPAPRRYDPDAYQDRPLDYPVPDAPAPTPSDGAAGKLLHLKDELSDKAAGVGEAVKEKWADASHAVKDTYDAAKARTTEAVGQLREKSADAYARARQQVVTTAEQHPLELGLVGLAAGLITGLLLPTPAVVNRSLGATADRLRDQAKESGSEMLAKGKRVAEAAVSAVKDEAQAQGLTPARLGEQARAVAEKAGEAGKEKAQAEGLAPATGAPPATAST